MLCNSTQLTEKYYHSTSDFYLIFSAIPATIYIDIKDRSDYNMNSMFGSDYITITDDEGHEYELEVLNTLEYNGYSYLAVIPAEADTQDPSGLQVCIIKSVEENGESILYTVDDDEELAAVNDLLMDSIFSEDCDD